MRNFSLCNIFKSFSVIGSIQALIVYSYILFLTHFATESEYATYVSISYIVDFAVAIGLFGFNLLIVREDDDFLGKNFLSFVSIAFAILLVSYLLYCVVIVDIDVKYAVAGFVLMVLQYFYQIGVSFQIKYRQNTLALVNVVANVLVTMILMVVLIVFNQLTAINVILVRIVQLVVFATICYPPVLRYILPIRVPSWNGIKDCFRLSLPIGGASIIGTFNIYIDKFISAMLSASETAQYSVARFEIPFLGIFMGNIALYFTPNIKQCMYKGDKEGVRSYLQLFCQYGWYVNVMIFTLLFCNAELFITTLYSETYITSVPLFKILVGTYLLRFIPYTNIIIALGIEKIIIKRQIVEMILQLTLSVILLKYWGLYGLAFSMILVLSLWSVPYNLWYYSKTIHQPIIEWLPLKEMFCFFIKCFVPCVIVDYGTGEMLGGIYKFIITILMILILCRKEMGYIYSNTR